MNHIHEAKWKELQISSSYERWMGWDGMGLTTEGREAVVHEERLEVVGQAGVGRGGPQRHAGNAQLVGHLLHPGAEGVGDDARDQRRRLRLRLDELGHRAGQRQNGRCYLDEVLVEPAVAGGQAVGDVEEPEVAGMEEEGLVVAGGKHSGVVVLCVDESHEEAVGEELSGEVHHGVDVALCGVREENGMGLSNTAARSGGGGGGSFLAAHLFYLRKSPLWIDGRTL